MAVLRHWLELRDQLAAHATHPHPHAVGALKPNHDGFGLTRPAGLPLHTTGLLRAHARAVASVNFLLAGTPGYEPLPRTPGLLRPDEVAQDAGHPGPT